MIHATLRIGIVTTLSTTEYHPFMLARLTNTLDHVADGRSGWNLVIGSNDSGAQNFGRDGQYSHDPRYDIADKHVELIQNLWDSWDADAMPVDREREIFVHRDKVRPLKSGGNGLAQPVMGRPVRPDECQACRHWSLSAGRSRRWRR